MLVVDELAEKTWDSNGRDERGPAVECAQLTDEIRLALNECHRGVKIVGMGAGLGEGESVLVVEFIFEL